MQVKPLSLQSSCILLAILFCFQAGTLMAQRDRVRGPIDNSRRVRLSDHVRPNLRAEDDLGRLSSSEKLPALTLVLGRSAEQQAALDRLLAEQQDPASPNYH